MRDYPAEFDNEGACAVCGKYADDCICPACPVCGQHGNPFCYEAHGLVRTEAQDESLLAHLADMEADRAAWEMMGDLYLDEVSELQASS